MRVFFVAAVALTLAACAEQPDVHAATAPVIVANANTELTAKSKLTCHKESSMGSNMIHTVCEADQSDADRIAAQDRMRDNMPNQLAAHPGIGSN